MSFKITKKIAAILATFSLKLFYVLQRVFMTFTLTYINRDNQYARNFDSLIIFLICVVYLLCVYQETTFVLFLFPNLFEIKNLISLANLGICTVCPLILFVSFQCNTDKLRRLINLFETLCPNPTMKYKHMRFYAMIMVLLNLIIINICVFLIAKYRGPFYQTIVVGYCVSARELWTISLLIEFCLWLNAFKTAFRNVTMHQVQMITKYNNCLLGRGRSLYAVYNYRESIRQYFRDVRLLMNVKHLIVKMYGMAAFLNILTSFCLILFHIHTGHFMHAKNNVAVMLATEFLKIGYLFWSTQATTLSVRIFNYFRI